MIEYGILMTTTEEKPMTVQVIDLQEGEVVEGATVTHIPPEGDPITIPPTVDSPYINMIFGPFGVVGQHYVIVHAEGSKGSGPEVLYSVLIKI